eukprot:CAMPEP_0201584490 /NCGR_PEP_ID=MMETSP0190_2-20130828/111249_1 /ASSEMBLY_ACC=CAM_ASM_000263 /TAXON_ID=37353 /ORGANISM="Rosalina sp." /LENGTH=40 /DNA_ID= /DNA_START= /DNA_END= /DNA_ORIENTATION=
MNSNGAIIETFNLNEQSMSMHRSIDTQDNYVPLNDEESSA